MVQNKQKYFKLVDQNKLWFFFFGSSKIITIRRGMILDDWFREWLCFTLNLIVGIFAAVALYRSLRFHGSVSFEGMVLAFNLGATLVLGLLKLFEQGYEYDLIGYFIEIFTYFLFAFTFGIVLLKMRGERRSSKKAKIYTISFLIIASILVILVLLVAMKVIERSCERNLVAISILTLTCQFLSYLPTVYNGNQIVKLLNVRNKSSMTETMLSGQIEINKSLSDQFTIERKKQVITVLTFYTATLIIRLALLIISFFIQDSDLLQCQNLQGIVIITSDYFLGQFVLILIEINQLLPHLIIPLAIFIIPMKTQRKNHNLLIDYNSYSSYDQEDQDTLESRSEIIKSKLSSIFNDKTGFPIKK